MSAERANRWLLSNWQVTKRGFVYLVKAGKNWLPVSVSGDLGGFSSQA
jgi:hypothetical protein